MPLGIPQREMGKHAVPVAGAPERLEEARAGDARTAASSRVWDGLQPAARGCIQHKGLQKRAQGGGGRGDAASSEAFIGGAREPAAQERADPRFVLAEVQRGRLLRCGNESTGVARKAEGAGGKV